MSTIVVPDYSYRRKGLGEAIVDFVGPIIGDWIKSEREKEVNRKNNAAIYEAAKSLGLAGNDYANLPPSMSGNNNSLLGGSNNGWENAFRNMSDNPLTQFDTNTADIAPNANPSPTLNQPQQRIPTPAEFMQAMANVVGSDTKRFGLVNMKNLQELAAPIMAAYETSRNEQRRKEVADAFSAASDNPLNQRNIITSAFINGLVPHELVTDATHNYEYENPHLIQGSYDAGGENYFYNYNPRTGQYNFSTQINKSLSPQDVANNKYRYDVLASQEKENAANREYNRYVQDSNLGYTRETRDLTREDNNRSRYTTIRIDPNTGLVYQEDQYGNSRPYMLDGKHLQVDPNNVPEWLYNNSSKNTGKSGSSNSNTVKTNDAYVATRRDALNRLQRTKNNLMKERNSVSTSNERKSEIDKQIADIDAESKRLNDELNTYIGGTSSSTSQTQSDTQAQQDTQNTNTQSGYTSQSNAGTNDGSPVVYKNPEGDTFTQKEYEDYVKRLGQKGADQYLRYYGYEKVDQSGDSVVMWRNPTTNRELTVAQYNEMRMQILTGDRAVVKSLEDLDPYLKSQGFQMITPESNHDIVAEKEKNTPTQTNNTAKRTVSPEQDWRPSYQRMPPSIAMTAPSTSVGKTPFPTAEEKERAATQGSTGSDIARVPESQNEAVLNGDNPPSNNYNGDEFNSEVMWTHPDGSTITKTEYQKRLREGNMSEEKAAQLYESLGYRRADNSNSPAPVGTDVVNGTTPVAMQKQVNYLNGDDVRNGTNFMGENLPALQPNGAMIASLTPMGLSGGRDNFRSLSDNNNRNPLNPIFDFLSESPAINQAVSDKYPNENYNPYDINADTGQPYDDNDVYEQGFKFDNEQNNGITIPDELNGGYKNLPLIKIPNTKEQGNLNHAMPIPNGDINEDVFSNMTLLAAPRNGRRRSGKGRAKVNTPVQTRQNTRLYTQNDYSGVRIPKRESRRPGRIKTNTSYQDLKPIVDDAAKRHGLNPELIRAIIQVESQWDSNALSNAGAKGLMQLMPGTEREVGVRDAYDVAQNINGGSKYIARMIRMFNGNVANALMAYNWGPGNMRKALKGRKSIPTQVRKYARDILSIYNRFKRK